MILITWFQKRSKFLCIRHKKGRKTTSYKCMHPKRLYELTVTRNAIGQTQPRMYDYRTRSTCLKLWAIYMSVNNKMEWDTKKQFTSIEPKQDRQLHDWTKGKAFTFIAYKIYRSSNIYIIMCLDWWFCISLYFSWRI